MTTFCPVGSERRPGWEEEEEEEGTAGLAAPNQDHWKWKNDEKKDSPLIPTKTVSPKQMKKTTNTRTKWRLDSV